MGGPTGRRTQAGTEPERIFEIEERLPLQERIWRVERASWGVFVLLILVALLGLSGGGGPLAHATAALGAGSVQYPRVARWQSSDDIEVSFPPGRARAEVTLSPALLQHVDIQHVVPEPAASRTGPEGATYAFALSGNGGTVDFSLRIQQPGWIAYAIALDGQAANLATLVLP